MESIQRTDALLIELLNENQTIDGFLEAIFGFMARRTDFYIEMKHPTDTMGFPPGINEQIVLRSMRKWKTLIQDDQQIPIANEIEISSNDTDELEVTTTVNDADVDDNNDTFQEYINNMNTSAASISEIVTIEPSKRVEFQDSEFYNGAKYKNYCWSQSINEIEICIHLPANIISSRQIQVTFKQDQLLVSEKQNETNVLLEGTIFKPCKYSCAMWMISDRKLHITLDKKIEGWWEKLLADESSIDTKKINCSRPIEELPEDTQVTIAKLQWDAEQKRLGKPTSDELHQEKLLRRAWNADGSPFKGTPYAPDTIKFS